MDENFYLNMQVNHAQGAKIVGTLEQGTKAQMMERMNELKFSLATETPASLELLQGLTGITENNSAVIHMIPAAFLEQSVISLQVSSQPL